MWTSVFRVPPPAPPYGWAAALRNEWGSNKRAVIGNWTTTGCASMMNVRGEIMRDALAPHPAYTRGGETHASRWQARSLPVRDVMSPSPLAIEIDAALSEAHRTMQERSTEHLLVFDADPVYGEKRLVGVLSDRDLVRHLRPLATRDDSESLRDVVFGAVNFAPITVGPESSVSDAAALMLHHGVSCLPVCTSRGRVVGVVTGRDLMHLLIT